MSLRELRVLGDPILRQPAVPVARVDDETRRLVDDLFETMAAAKGVGLAAPQVGVSQRVVVVDAAGQRHALINPSITHHEGRITWEEGCLSIPEVFAHVQRSALVTVRALDEHGEEIELQGSELLGVCLQHELDHLDGRLFIDHLSFLKRRAALAKWEELKGEFPEFRRVLTPGDPGDADADG